MKTLRAGNTEYRWLELTKTIDNPLVDKRTRHDWRLAAQFPAGMRFRVEKTLGSNIDAKHNASDLHRAANRQGGGISDWGSNKNTFDFIVSHSIEVSPTLEELMKGLWVNAEEVLDALIADHRLDPAVIEEVILRLHRTDLAGRGLEASTQVDADDVQEMTQ